jgi:hypothetical protein
MHPGPLDRLEGVAQAYQAGRPDLETSDWTLLAIRALFRCDISDIKAVSDIAGGTPREFAVKTASAADSMRVIEEDLETDIDGEKITSRAVGRILAEMRLNKARKAGKGTRGYRVTVKGLARLSNA